jgi:DNA polymerase/3'-5' exonuclease PolX
VVEFRAHEIRGWNVNLQTANEVAREVIGALWPECEKVEIAGSVRRRKLAPKDIEIVFIPKMVERPVDMFNTERGPATDMVVDRLVEQKVLIWDMDVKRNGPRYKRLIHVAQKVVIELFAAQADNWGLILALRTGPGDFNQMMVSHPWQGGAMPMDMMMQDGYLWRRGEKLASRTEEEFFAQIGLPCWSPEMRSMGRLSTHLDIVRRKYALRDDDDRSLIPGPSPKDWEKGGGGRDT